MKPEYYDYSRYLEVYDLFSSLDHSQWSKVSFTILDSIFQIKILEKEKVYISDIGAGTGFYSTSFLHNNTSYWKNIFFSFVEPSRSMREILEKKIKGFKNTLILPYKAEEALKYMQQQDIFIFQRSLYSFYPKNKLYKYNQLIDSLYKKLNPNGFVIVGEFYEKFNVELLESRIDNNYYKTNLPKKEESEAFLILKQAILDFNSQVDNGEFTLFKKSELIELFLNNSFVVEKEVNNFIIFKKMG